MELEYVGIMISMGIWGICNLFVLFVILSAAIQRRTIDLIRGGLFLKVLAMTIAVNVHTYTTYHGLPHLHASAPHVVWAMATIGAIGALMICRGLLR